ncbi:MAG: hypothetical protein NVS1B1_06550 [Candidatus Limnocylindrales bacterium]
MRRSRNAFRTHAAYNLGMIRALAWTLWSVALAFAAAGAALVLVSLDAMVPDNWGFRGYTDLTAPAFATAGLLIVRRLPGNAVGWLLLVAGVASGFGGFVQEYAIRAVIIAPGSLPGAVPLAWIASWSFAFTAGPMLMLMPQLFPTGRPLGRRWVPLVWVGAAFIPIAFFLFGLKPGPLENATFIDNPLSLDGGAADIQSALRVPLSAVMALTALASGAALAVRFRRARGVEREQLKWVASSAAFNALAFGAMIASNTSKPAQVLMVAALTSMPVAIGIAITRYRLYDIDVLINRALVYGPTTGSVAVAFFAGIVVLQALLRPLTSGSEVAVAVSTLISVALFQPLRQRVQDAVDRRFYRSRYDAARTLDTFSLRLRDQVALDAVRSDLLEAVRETVQPAHAALWLRSE